MNANDVTLLIDDLRAARHVTILTGAGISAESGLPTFRDPLTGHWASFNPQDLATPEAFRRNPHLVWRWYAERRKAARAARPNPGHLALSRLQSLVAKVTLVTQNVDGLHQAAGSNGVIELHGNIHASRCFENDHPLSLSMEEAESTDSPPHCPDCGSLARPGVVWFGETLPEGSLQAAVDAARTCDVMLVVGTSGVVQPAASLASVSRSAGATVAVINPDLNTAVPGCLFLKGPAGEILPEILEMAWPK